MITKNLTPFLVGTKVCSRRPPAPELTLIVKGVFSLAPGRPVEAVKDLTRRGFLRAERFAPSDVRREGACLYGGDFADFKLNAEVLLQGSCHVPGGKARTECPVKVSLGDWSKSLRVVGPRRFKSGLGKGISEPEPFTEMPIVYDNAFGGPGYAQNPVGKGHKTDELPTVEHPGDLITTRTERLVPAGFGPLNPAWPQRAAKVGRAYGKKWVEERAPYFAEDFHFSYFSAAPADQQLPGFVRGDEELHLQNLHPDAPLFSTRLPGLRVRVFVRDVKEQVREVGLSLDTVLCDLNGGLLHLTWRGVTGVEEDDGSDVAYALVATEPLEEERADAGPYVQQLEAFAADPTGLHANMPRELLELNEVVEKARAGTGPDHSAPTVGDGNVAQVLQLKLGGLVPDAQRQVAEAAEQLGDKVRPHRDLAQEIRAALDKTGDSPPTPVTKKPGVMPSTGLRRTMREVMQKTAALRAGLEGKNVPADKLARLDELDRVPFDARWQQLDPDYTPPVEPIGADPPGPGANLRDRDLSGADLSGRDLSGADLRGALLVRTRLNNALLCGANLRNAVLYRADLSGADLSEADLTRVNAAQVLADWAVFRRAKLEQAFFRQAALTSADFDGAEGSYTVFDRADLSGASLDGVRFSHVDFSRSLLACARLRRAVLVRCSFDHAEAAGVDLTRSSAERCTFRDADLTGAVLYALISPNSLWAKAVLDEADLRHAQLREAWLERVSARRANLYAADLCQARLGRAVLDGATIEQANLFRADLQKASLAGASFRSAHLFEAKLRHAKGDDGTRFDGAILTRTLLEPS